MADVSAEQKAALGDFFAKKGKKGKKKKKSKKKAIDDTSVAALRAEERKKQEVEDAKWAEYDQDTAKGPVINTGGKKVKEMKGNWRPKTEGEQIEEEYVRDHAEVVSKTHDWGGEHEVEEEKESQQLKTSFPTLSEAADMPDPEPQMSRDGFQRVGGPVRRRLNLLPRSKPLAEGQGNRFGALAPKVDTSAPKEGSWADDAEEEDGRT